MRINRLISIKLTMVFAVGLWISGLALTNTSTHHGIAKTHLQQATAARQPAKEAA